MCDFLFFFLMILWAGFDATEVQELEPVVR